MRFVVAAAILLTGFIVTPQQANAQNGQLIEGLFRTWANSQAESEKRKRKEAEERARRAEAQRDQAAKNASAISDPYKVQLPSGFGRGNIATPAPQLNRPTTRPSQRPSTIPPVTPRGASLGRQQINVRSKAAAEYAERLISFRSNYDGVVQDLKRGASRNAAIRELLPSAYQVSATCDSLIDRLDGLNSLHTIEKTHRLLDQRYRKVAYRIRALDGLSDSCGALVKQCDSTCGLMANQLGFQPQFDRAAIDTELISAATHMQCLGDDLDLIELDRGRCRKFQHDCRLMRQQLLAARRELSELPYEACVERFSQFMGRWNQLSVSLYQLNNPFVARRLDRISECADRSYGLLWMDSPTSLGDAGGIAHRLRYDLQQISKSLTFFSMSNLTPRQQDQLVGSLRDLNAMAAEMENVADGPNAGRVLPPLFTRFDQTWFECQDTLSQVISIRHGLIAETERGCQQLRELLGIHRDYATPLRFAELVSTAAALEGTTEYLHKTLNELERFMQPSSYRSAVSRSSASFYRHTREVHEQLSRTERLNDPKHLAKLQEEAEHLLTDWNQLAGDLDNMEAHGVTGSRAAQVRQLQGQIVPMLGQIAAALVQR